MRSAGLLVLMAMLADVGATPLHEVAVGDRVAVPGFAYAEGKSFTQPIHLRRIEVYAEDARILLPLAGGGFRELPRSDRRFFVADRDKTASRLYLSVSADGRDFEGGLFNADGIHAFSGTIEDGRLIRRQGGKLEDRGASRFSCGTDHAFSRPAGLPREAADAVPTLGALSKGATHRAVIAVDTDNEMFTQKFSDNPTGLLNATNYLASLFAGMNVYYGRDLSVSLLQGTTFLRAPHAGGPDPYVQSSTGNQLNEVGSTWLNTPSLASLDRAFVMFLSGKSGSPNQSSGIAWVLDEGNYCTDKGVSFGGGQVFGHYSVSQVFRFAVDTSAFDVELVGHELGHNFGAEHTHCSNRTTGAGGQSTNTIDQCFTGESGCYSGPVSCPTDNSVAGRGSVMSYCHFPTASGGANCGPALLEFHPAHENLLGARVATNIGNGCFAALNQNVGPTLSANSPANGSTTPMGGGTVGATLSRKITFSVSGGAGTGTTSLVCTVTAGTVAIASGTPQTIAVNGTAAPVVARFTLTGSAQSGTIGCTATPVGGTVSNLSYTFTANAGTAGCSGTCIMRSGFEAGEI